VPEWLIWLIAAGVLAGAETLSLNFVLIMCAGGAAAGAVTAAAGGPAALQVVVAIATACVLLLFIRPVAARHLLSGPTHVSGTAALVGKRAVVSTEVGPRSGLVRLNGQDWSARSVGEGHVYPPGTHVRVVEISGATAVVFEEPFSQSA
jgi:membrane protein implicated in regulation of membrane protease activity